MAYIGYGSDLQTDLSGSMISAGSVVEFTPPPLKVKDVDVSYTQMAQAWRQFQAGLVDGGELKFTLVYAFVATGGTTNYTMLLAKVRTTGNWNCVFNDKGANVNNSVLAFSGYVNAMPWKYPLDDMIVIDVQVKVSGAFTFTPAH